MAGYLIGFGFVAFAVWRISKHRVPDGGIEFTGTIVKEVTRNSTQTGWSHRLLYAPLVSFQH